ncbi:MAG: GNAT family N-acetyltransferase [Nanoarchaeota archaeon]
MSLDDQAQQTYLRGPLSVADIDAALDPIMGWINNPEVRFHFARPEINREKERAWLQSKLPSDGFRLYLIENSDHQPIGQVSIDKIFRQDDRLIDGMLGITLHPNYQGEGHAKRAIQLLHQRAFEEVGVNKLWAKIRPHNAEMKHILESLGWQYECTRLREYVDYETGELTDMDYYCLFKNEWVKREIGLTTSHS